MGQRAWSIRKIKLTADGLQLAVNMMEVGGALRFRLEAKIRVQIPEFATRIPKFEIMSPGP